MTPNSKNSLLLLILLCFSAFNAYPEVIEQTYHFEQPQIVTKNDGTQLVSFKNSYPAGIHGQPTIPLLKIALALPEGHEATQIKLSYTKKKSLNLPINLAPRQYPRTLSQPNSTYYRNNQVYQSLKPIKLPEKYVKTHYLNGHSVAFSTFSPIEYIPGSQKLTYFSEVTVHLETTIGTSAQAALKNISYTLQVKQKLMGLVDNQDAVDAWSGSPNDDSEYDYLIVTIQSFGSAYQPLADFYNERGISTRIVTVESIEAEMSGLDLQEKIRNHIIQEYQESGIRFVLLAGDTDRLKFGGQMQVPARGFYCTVESEWTYEDSAIPSDLYYAALDGNWDSNGNAKWGEPDEADLLPELAVGRICADNLTEINNQIQKIINYQDSPVVADASKMLFVAELMWSTPLTYGSDYLNLLVGASNENGYQTTGFPTDLDFTYLYEKNTRWYTEQLLTAINAGCNFINHSGHANQSQVMKLTNPSIIPENFTSTDGREHLNPIVYSHGCKMASIDYQTSNSRDCIAEEMLSLPNFAVAVVGNSRDGWLNEGQTEGPSLHLHREFVNALYGDALTRIGETHTMSRIHTAPFLTAPDQWEPGALRWCFYGCTLLGDPAMDLWTHKLHHFTQVSFPDSLPVESSTITIECGEENTLVTLSAKETNRTFSALSDASGSVLIPVDSLNVADFWKLVLTRHNFVPFKTELPVRQGGGEVADISTNSSETLPFTFALSSVYPNPFNPTTSIRFSLGKPGFIRLAVFNSRGQLIRILKQATLPAGKYQHQWNVTGNSDQSLASGIYYLQLKSAEGSLVKRAVFVQ